jgi:hypothetical protein
MKPITHPPDVILRAYGDLIRQVFLFLRIHARAGDINQEAMFDLADAMHIVAEVLTDYGAWVDDEKYRALYLRPFDTKWGQRSIQLEQFLERRLREHREG